AGHRHLEPPHRHRTSLDRVGVHDQRHRVRHRGAIPAPTTSRAATNVSAVGASPHRIVPMLSTTAPPMNIRRWPYTSPSRPSIGVPTAIIKNRPVTDKLRNDAVESRSSAIVGSDADTIVIDDENTMIAARIVIRRRLGYPSSTTWHSSR